MLLSESYREINKKLHEDPVYGISGHKSVGYILTLCNHKITTDVLDYGCGKATLEQALGFPIQNYDPCVEEYSKRPKPARIVACTDVLEHVEPECIDEVLRDIASLTLETVFLLIANRPANKTLPDGRNAHLIQEGPEWWLPRIWKAGLKLERFTNLRNSGKVIAFAMICNKGD